MKHEIKKLEKSAVEIVMTLSKEEFAPLKKEILANAQKTVEIPGFRKGHAPIDQIEAKYAEGIKEELTDKVLKKYFGEVVTAENLKPVSPMYNVSVKMDEETFEVTCSVDVFPEVTLGEYKGIEIEKTVFEMTEDKLNEEIERMLTAKAELKDAEDGYQAQMGDTVDLAFEGFVDGVAFEGGKADSHLLKLGSNMFIPGFEDQLVGYTKGQEGEVNVTFPAEYHAANLAGKPAVFKVKINAVKLLNKPELNEEFAKENGFESVEDLKTKKSEEVAKRGEENAKNENRGKMLRKVTEASTVEVPQSLVIREVEAKLADLEQQLMMQGMDLNGYLKMTGMTMDTIYNQLAPMSENKVKMDLILDKISQVENLEVSEDEVKEKTEEVAKMYGMTPEILKEELDKTKRYESFINSIKTDLLMSKAIELIEANVK